MSVWTAVKTWTASLVSVPDLQTYVSDNTNYLKDQVDVRTKVLDLVTTEQDVTNTGVETSVWSFTVPGGTLGTTRALRLTLTGYIDLNTISHNLSMNIKWGGSTVLALANFVTTASTKGLFILHVFLNADGTAQRIVGRAHYPTTAIADGVMSTSIASAGGAASSAADASVDQPLQVTMQWDTGTTTEHFKRWMACLELLKLT